MGWVPACAGVAGNPTQRIASQHRAPKTHTPATHRKTAQAYDSTHLGRAPITNTLYKSGSKG